MANVFAIWVCVSCLFVSALTQVDCAEEDCEEEQQSFDLLQVKQILKATTIERNTTPARTETGLVKPQYLKAHDVCSQYSSGLCYDCVIAQDVWCASHHWDNLCYEACCGTTAYAVEGCELQCSGTSVCSDEPSHTGADGLTVECADGSWHEAGEESHTCAWVGEDPSYRCSDSVSDEGLNAWQVCKQSCGICDLGGCYDGHWHEGDDTHNCLWVAEDPAYRCTSTGDHDDIKAWQVCKESCGLCGIPSPCTDGHWHEVDEDSHNCAWVGEDPSYRCSDTESFEGLKAWEVCRESCGLCDGCADGSWHADGEESHDCAWVGEDPSYRCSDTGDEGHKAWEVCKQSCGLCDCVDDPSWHEASDPSHDCAWVLQTMAIDPNTCVSAMGDGASPEPAWKGCPLSCGACSTPPEEPSVLNDPHMTSLGGDKFDVNQPADYVLLRAPLERARPAMFEVRATMEADEVTPCGLYVKAVTLSGTWFGGANVHVRPLKRNKAGSNTAGNATEWPFSMQISSQGPWKSFSDLSAGNGTQALTDTVKIIAAQREQFAGLLEGQAFTFRIGRNGRPAVIVVSQAAHQALNVELANVKALGQRTLGGLLGTEKHFKGVEELTEACKAYKGNKVAGGGKSALIVGSKLPEPSWLTASWF